ncbi:MAG TPA: hypothetical protein VJS44_03835 [Pyrinomonadaceae bacterium]|nr:hypothetical protein [Pyrinomonadaceae bacterium]
MTTQNLFPYGFLNHISGKAFLTALILLAACVPASAQNEAKNWFFGDKGGLSFSSATPAALTGSAMTTNEGSAVMSDQNGNLLFYTDGVTVWNKNHQMMPNGFGLQGHSSATQSAIIVPWPGTSCQKYFIFTTGAVENGAGTLRYSVVDMMLAGGLGDIIPISKNVALKNMVSEKLTAVRDGAGTGFWVIVHGFVDSEQSSNVVVRDQFYAYHVDASGINTVPTTSTAGTMHSGGLLPSQGQMKVSPDGKLIASAVRNSFVEILNFNNATGQVSGPATTFNSWNPPFQISLVYGLEFSPNSKLLYVTTTGGSPNQLLQLDLSTSTWTQLYSSTGTGNYYDTGELQLGPDKKLYVARFNKSYLSVVNSPNSVGSGANFVATGPALTTGSVSKLGLPTIVSGDFSCAGTTNTGGQTSQGCCDQISAIPSWNPKTKQDRRVFTVTNTKLPQSPICYIDINFNPPTTKQGDILSIDSAFFSSSIFTAPFNRIPNTGTISASNSVMFRLSVDYTTGWSGTVSFVVHHCDGTVCTLNYGPWTATPPANPNPIQVSGNFISEGRFSTLSFRLLPAERRRPVKWISFSVEDSQGQLFAGAGAGAREARGAPSTDARVEGDGLDASSVLYAFSQPLKSGEASGTFELVVSRPSPAMSPPRVVWTTFDANGNAIETGTINSQPGGFNIPR